MNKARFFTAFLFFAAIAGFSMSARAQSPPHPSKALAQYPPVVSPSDVHIASNPASNVVTAAPACNQCCPTQCCPSKCCPGRCGACCNRVSPWRSPGNMPLHYPYEAEPENYYYFRPYNYMHIAEQQSEASYWADPRLPYSNEVFQDVYAKLGMEEIQPKLPEKEVEEKPE